MTHSPDNRDFNSRDWRTLLETEWNSGATPDSAHYFSVIDQSDLQLIGDLMELDLECRWRRFSSCEDPSAKDPHGFPMFPRIDDYAAIFSEELRQQILIPRFIAEEYRVRARWGDRPEIESFLERFPEYGKSLHAALLHIDADFAKEAICISGISSTSHSHGSTIVSDQFEVDERISKRGKVLPSERFVKRDYSCEENESESVAVNADNDTRPSSPADGEPQIPQRIGRYRVDRVLGKGSFGTVYLAYDDRLDRHVAVKVPHAELVDTAVDTQFYLNEARTVAKLDHPHIVPVHDVDKTDECPLYIVSKYIDGSDLATVVKTTSFPYTRAAKLVEILARALHYAHLCGVVHRDLKPGNILVDTEGKPYVVDFGLALREENLGQGPSYVGTPAYMSPEQALGEGHRVDGRSDIYSLGAILYELLTKRKTVSAKSKLEILRLIGTVEPKPPRQINDKIPKELERICLKALAKRVAERYSTAIDMADDLQHFLKTEYGVEESPGSSGTPLDSDRESQRHSEGSDSDDSGSVRLQIVPKGLRSFDQHDADFFLQLLPGPRDREGLPESLRFWKTRIEETDANQTFEVGLIYGPSGCGKSSFVKAGLIPHLKKQTAVVLLEAEPEGTESRLLERLRQKFPSLRPELSLRETLAELRRTHLAEAGGKVLIVIDQFEQYLHTHLDDDQSELAQALRQCDGKHLQCLLLIRDDFWMAISQFMRDVEVPIREGLNSMAVDLFSIHHAQQVLTEYGRAFDALPDDPKAITKSQREFLERSVEGLSREGKVICVRLALFAQTIKDKPWKIETLKKMGGPAGVGVTFLEETFGSSSAPPEHRVHLRAARAVLQMLLPDHASEIKGNFRSYRELLEASGYVDRLDDFDRLMHILDDELRLVTPTETDELHPREDGNHRERLFQLTHDYLVPALRSWLTRQKRESRRGRAELLLNELSAFWHAKPENRQLPDAWEFLKIRSLTNRKDWSETQKRMMRRAFQMHFRRACLLLVGLFVMAIGFWEIRGRIRSNTKMESLLHTQAKDVPLVIQGMEGYHRWLDDDLRNQLSLSRSRREPDKALRLSLALLPSDDSQLDFVVKRMLSGSAPEVMMIRECLVPHAPQLETPLWNILQDGEAEPEERFRAACFLAKYAPDDPRWTSVNDVVISQLMAEKSISLNAWAEALSPIAESLLPSLAEYVAGSRDADDLQRLSELYAEFSIDAADGFRYLQEILREHSDETAGADLEFDERRASAASALVIAGEWEHVWPLLEYRKDPTLRNILIERLGQSRLNTQEIIDRLRASSGISTYGKSALILILGEQHDRTRSDSQRAEIVAELAKRFHSASDANIRSATEWSLRQWRAWTSSEESSNAFRLASPMVSIPPDWFRLEDTDFEDDATAPSHEYAIAIKEVTVAEYLRFREDHVWDRRAAQSMDCPVNEVTWYDAAAYCNWLSEQEDLPEEQWCYAPNPDGEYASGMTIKSNAADLAGYRLPTINEWEFACHAGTATFWSFGDAQRLIDRYAWSSSNSGVHSWPVGMLRPNGFGLFDMHGNVWEWCHDIIDAEGNPSLLDSSAPQVIYDDTNLALRGGTFLTDPRSLGSESENWNRAAHHTNADGFRVVRTVVKRDRP